VTKKTKILLLFPPISDPMNPYLSLPSLTAVLRQSGYEVVQRDLNIEALDRLLTRENLSRLYKRTLEIFGRTKKDTREGSLYPVLAEVLFFAPSAVENIDKAKEILRSGRNFYNRKRYAWSTEIYYNALKLLLREKYPFDKRLRVSSYAELMAAIEDPEANPFLGFLEESTAKIMSGKPPDIVGISVVYFTQMLSAFTLAQLIKKKRPDVTVVLGGGIITNLIERLPRNRGLFSMVDAFVAMEGEHALLEIVRRLERGRSLQGIPNVVTARDPSDSFSNGNRFIEPVDELPTPDFDGMPFKRYFSPEPIIPLLTSRGCYWGRCAFCNSANMLGGGFYRSRRLDLIVDDLRSLSKRYDARYFCFSDNAVAPAVLRGLSHALLKNRMRIFWLCEVRFEKEFTPELCRLMFAAGCRSVSFGFEAATDRLLDLMDKGTKVKTMKPVLHNFRNAGITTDIQFFIGFPTQTKEEVRETLSFIRDQRSFIDTVSFTGGFRLIRDARIFSDAKRFGIRRVFARSHRDFRLNHDYETVSGLSMREAGALAMVIRERMEEAFPARFMYPAPNLNAHRLLYSSRGVFPHDKV